MKCLLVTSYSRARASLTTPCDVDLDPGGGRAGQASLRRGPFPRPDSIPWKQVTKSSFTQSQEGNEAPVPGGGHSYVNDLDTSVGKTYRVSSFIYSKLY